MKIKSSHNRFVSKYPNPHDPSNPFLEIRTEQELLKFWDMAKLGASWEDIVQVISQARQCRICGEDTTHPTQPKTGHRC